MGMEWPGPGIVDVTAARSFLINKFDALDCKEWIKR